VAVSRNLSKKKKSQKLQKKNHKRREKYPSLHPEKNLLPSNILRSKEKKGRKLQKRKRVLDFLHQVLVNQIRIFSIFLKKQIF